MSLTTEPAAGSQAATADPQASPADTSLSGQSSALQPGDSNNVLNSSTATGIPLNQAPASTVNLAGRTSATQSNPSAVRHKANPVMLGFTAGLFLIAIIVFVSMQRAAKNTTNY